MRPEHVFVIGAVIFVAVLMFRSIRRDRSKLSAEAKPTDQTPVPRRDRAVRGPIEACEACGEPDPRFAPPTIVEVRSMIDLSFLDDMLLRAGFRRAMRHAVSVHRDIDVEERLCESCHRVARMVCEAKVADIDSSRAAAAKAEASDVARFTSFGMLVEVREEVREQRDRREASGTGP